MAVIETIEKLRERLLSVIEQHESIGLVTHKNPDGDGLSACIALQEILKAKKKNPRIILEQEAPDSFALLGARERSEIYNEEMSFSLVLIIDCKNRSRVGRCAPLLDKAELILAIDHHEDNSDFPGSDGSDPSPVTADREPDFVYNDPQTVSAGAILYQALKEEIHSLPAKSKVLCATALYITIINDTNNFTNKNTDQAVFEISAGITGLGIKPHKITKAFLYTKPASYFRFIGQTMSTIETLENGRVLFFHSDLKMLHENNLRSDATTKVTDWIKKPEGIEVIIYARELDREKYRLSLRSEYYNVNIIAVKFGGGGHISAAGCEMSGTLADIKTTVLTEVRKQLPSTTQD